MASISWVDSLGVGLLSNQKSGPAANFFSWSPDIVPIGPSRVGLGTGLTYQFSFRDDDIVSFEMRYIPGSQMSLMRRLKAHLMKGGAVSLNSSNILVDTTYGVCCIAPGEVPKISPPDAILQEYTMSFVLKGIGPDYAFATNGEMPMIKFWTATGSLISTYDSGLDPEENFITTMCAARDGTVWAALELSGDDFTTLVQVQPADGSVIQTIELDRLIGGEGAGPPSGTARCLLQLADGDLLSMDRDTGNMIRIAIPSATITAYALNFSDGAFDAAINAAGTHIIYVGGEDRNELRLYDLEADDGVGTLIKDFGSEIAWPTWLADSSILIQTGNVEDPANATFGVGRQSGADPASSGSFTLTFRSETTAAIPYNATGADIAAALELLPSIGTGNVQAATGSSALTINDALFLSFEWIGDLGNQAVEAPTITDSTDTTVLVYEGDAGTPGGGYDGDVGQFSTGDMARLTMSGTITKTYSWDKSAVASSGEGLYGFTGSIAANRVWIYGDREIDISTLLIHSLSSGTELDIIETLEDFDGTDVDKHGSIINPFFGGYEA